MGLGLCKYAPAKQVVIDLDNGLSPVRRQAIIWIDIGLLLFRP